VINKSEAGGRGIPAHRPPTPSSGGRRAILQVPRRGTCRRSITLNDRLAERIAVLAAEASEPVDGFVERVLQGWSMPTSRFVTAFPCSACRLTRQP
jgi:hypothetical protein